MIIVKATAGSDRVAPALGEFDNTMSRNTLILRSNERLFSPISYAGL